VNGRYAIRMAIGSVLTERRHVEAAWQLLSTLATQPGQVQPGQRANSDRVG
jgi:hypothetical protein